MQTLVVIIAANILALLLAMMLNLSVTEVYAFLAFNFTGLLFIGFTNLVLFVKENVVDKKEGTNDATGITKDS